MKLTVRPLKNQDPGSGMAVIDRQVLKELELSSGDFIAIKGRDGGQTVARVWPSNPEDAGRRIIRIDGQLRQQANASIDENVTIEKIDIKPADQITIALPQNLRIKGDLGPHLRKKLVDQAVKKGQTIEFSIGFGIFSDRVGKRIPLKIVDTKPSGTVVIQNDTNINITEKSAEDVKIEESKGTETSTPRVAYEDIGGLDKELEQVREMIELPMRRPELFQQLGIEPPKGVLLHGPPGTGKTLIAKAVANEIDANFQTISGPEIMSKYYGESEEQLREIFEDAEENAPSIVFIDEIDSIAPKREDVSGDVERRIVAQLLSLMDGLEERGRITVIGTTNRIDAIDPALRRPGRFDREIEIGVPDKKGRKEILQIHTRGMPITDEVDLEKYAENTHGFVGADLANLAKESAMHALRRIRPDINLEEEISADTLESIKVTREDFKQALKSIEPSALREVFVEVPDVTWNDVGGLKKAKEKLQEAVQWPLEYSEAYERAALEPAKGVLLYGPPGTGKTLLAKAVANESQSNFISVKGPELFNKYVGESEKGVREIFSKARENAPTIIFFDEIDSIASERGSGGMGDSNVGERVVSQLLTELDGLEVLEDVIVIAATNRLDLIDDALLRPGRLDKHINVSTPDEETRKEIFKIHTRDKPLVDEVDLDDLAERTEGYVGADIEAVCREAAQIAVREYINKAETNRDTDVDEINITMNHFNKALKDIKSSISSKEDRFEDISA